jgi:hypothetical protein
MECIICLDKTKYNSCGVKPKGCNDVKLKCKHIFHRNCIKKWFVVNDTCPVCRTNMKFYEGSYYKFLMHIFCLRKIIFSINNILYNCSFIYHDNASIILFINFIKQNLLHYSSMISFS